MIDKNPIVYVIDDDASVCLALERLMRSAGYQVKTFPSAIAFLDHGLSEQPCCLILDVEMPELTGLDLQQELAARGISIPIIFLTGHGTIPMSVQAMKTGAADFLTKPCDDKELLEAVKEAIEKNMLERSEKAELDAIRKRIDSLTKREEQIFRMVTTGMLNKQIAYELRTARQRPGPSSVSASTTRRSRRMKRPRESGS